MPWRESEARSVRLPGYSPGSGSEDCKRSRAPRGRLRRMLCAGGGSGLLRGESSSRAKPCRRSFSRAESRKGDAYRAIAPAEALCRGPLPVSARKNACERELCRLWGPDHVFFGRYRFRCHSGAKPARQTQALWNFAQAGSGREKEYGRLGAGCGGKSMPPTPKAVSPQEPSHAILSNCPSMKSARSSGLSAAAACGTAAAAFFLPDMGEALDGRGFRQRRIRRSKHAVLL